jgi:hypothetical protein
MNVRLLVLIAAGALAAASVGISAQRSAASCIAAVQFRGALYYGTTVSVTPKLSESLGTGTVPTCSDQIVNGKPYHPIPAHRVRLTRIRGISPSLAKLRIHIPPRLRANVQHAYEARARTLAFVARCYRGSFIAASVTPG